MALNDDAVLQVGTGHFYRADIGEAAPTDLSAPGGNWAEIGHTSLEDVFATNSEGGDVTTLGTLQKKTLKQAYSPRTETFTFNLAQWDQEALQLYFGSNAAEISVGSIWMGVPDTPAPTQSAFLATFTDGVDWFGFYAPKSELYREDDMEIGDTESLALLPIKVTPLNHSTNTWKYAVTPMGAA